MKILAAADLHYQLPHYDWLLEQAPEFDAVVMPGDHLDITGAVPVEAQIVVLSKYFERFGSVTQLLVSSGNHDLDGPGSHGEQVPRWMSRIEAQGVHVDGACVDIGTTRFTLCPWWDGPVTNAEVAAQFERDSIDRPDSWVWLYHSPPAGTGLCRTGQTEFPDNDLARWIDRWSPDLVFTGHIHQAPWVKGGGWAAQVGRTWVFNAGRTIGPMPAHIVVDTETGVAEWYGLPDQDQVSIHS